MIGQTISHYRITRQLGAGGMGVVYEAVDTKLDRTVALKFLPPESTSDPDAKARFVHEAKAASALDHKNVCVIYEIDETEDGQLFLVMACYEGETLKERIDRGPLPIEEAVDITRQVAEGLAKAHEREIVHRDIKPANIFLTEDGPTKILDFGLAKLAGQTLLTKTGTTLGTAGYMSPEQAGGKATDSRTDIWCLGVVLYEMVTGRRPFLGDQEQAIIYGILNLDPDPVTGLRTGVPMGLERIIGKCLAKDPNERYQGSEELLADLRHLQRETAEGVTVTMQSPGNTTKPRRWPWVISAFLALVLAVVYITKHFPADSEEAPSGLPMLAVLPFENLGNPEDEYFADGITEEIIVKMVGIDGLRVLARNSTQGYKGSEKPLAEIGRELGVEYILEGTIRWQKNPDGISTVRIAPMLLLAKDGTHLWATTITEDLTDIFKVQGKIATRVAEAMGVELGPATLSTLEKPLTNNTEAYDLYLKGLEYEFNWSDSRMAEKAAQMYERAVALDPDFAEAWSKICHLRAWVYRVLNPDNSVLEQARRAADTASKLDPNNVDVLTGLGFFEYNGNRNFEEAMKYFDHALDLSPGKILPILGKAYVLRRTGEFELSMKEFEKATVLDPRNFTVWFDLAGTAGLVRDFDKMEWAARRQISMWPDEGDAYTTLIEGLVSIDGDTSRAARVLDQALEHDPTWEFLNPGDDIRLARSFYSAVGAAQSWILRTDETAYESIKGKADLVFMKALVSVNKGQPAEARSNFHRVLELLSSMNQADPGIYFIYPLLASSYSGLDRHEEAIALCKAGFKYDSISQDHLDNSRLSYDLAAAYSAAGMEDEAIDLLEELLSRPSPLNRGYLRADPAWDPLRENLRLQKLLAESH